MMVGSLESDIKNVCNKPFDNHEVLDDFDDSDSDKDVSIQNMQVIFNNVFIKKKKTFYLILFV